MTDAQLAEIAARLRAATPGPFIHSGHGCIRGGPVRHFERGSSQTQVAMTTGQDWMTPEEQLANAEMLAHAPQDTAALIAEVKTLTALNEHAESERERQAAEIERLCANGRAVEAQLEAVTRERDAAVNDANRQKDQHERLRVSLAVALGLLSEMEYWRQLTGTRFEAPLRNFLADMRAGR